MSAPGTRLRLRVALWLSVALPCLPANPAGTWRLDNNDMVQRGVEQRAQSGPRAGETGQHLSVPYTRLALVREQHGQRVPFQLPAIATYRRQSHLTLYRK